MIYKHQVNVGQPQKITGKIQVNSVSTQIFLSHSDRHVSHLGQLCSVQFVENGEKGNERESSISPAKEKETCTTDGN
jgi:hypothetical protein